MQVDSIVTQHLQDCVRKLYSVCRNFFFLFDQLNLVWCDCDVGGPLDLLLGSMCDKAGD